MSGNVFEWVQDGYQDAFYTYAKGVADNPINDEEKGGRVLRGGSWSDYPDFLRASYRGRIDPEGRNYSIGFRCAGTP